MGDRIDPRHGLEPSRKGVNGDERVGEECQREHDHYRHSLDGADTLGFGPDPKEDPGEGPAGDDGEHHPGEHAENAAIGAVTHDYAYGEGDAGSGRALCPNHGGR